VAAHRATVLGAAPCAAGRLPAAAFAGRSPFGASIRRAGSQVHSRAVRVSNRSGRAIRAAHRPSRSACTRPSASPAVQWRTRRAPPRTHS